MFKRIYPYKDLFYIFIWREYSVRYRQSLIGILWAILQPLSMMLLFTFIFTYILKLKISDYPRAVFFYAGLLPWTFFSSSLIYSISSLSSNYELITKIYFPREILPLSGIMVALLDYLIAAIFFVFMLILFKIQITWAVLWMIPLLILLFIFTISMSLILSSLNVYYRDVKLATGFFIQLLFFASPILYSINNLNIKLKLLLFFNPLTFIIENMRRCVIEGRGVVIWQFIFVTILVFLFYKIAYSIFTKTEKNFADII